MAGRLIMIIMMICWWLLGNCGLAVQPGIDPEDLSIKAGPTEPGEPLSIVWLETFAYPKVVKNDRVVSLGGRLASKVDSVTATFDFSQDKIKLVSEDGLSWSGGYQVPEKVTPGLHAIRYLITDHGKTIQRTVDFFVAETDLSQAKNIAQGEVISAEGWPLIVPATCAAFSENTVRILYAGEELLGVSKSTWYRVIFADGQAGWIAANLVNEPGDQFFAQGYQAYEQGKFQDAIKYLTKTVAINDQFKDGYFWLAKSYYRVGDLAQSALAVKAARQLDERDLDTQVLAQAIAFAYYKIGHEQLRAGRYNEAVAALRNAVELKPASLASWIELGKCYEQLGLTEQARTAWREALKLDPAKSELYAFLGLNIQTNLPVILADDSLKIVKQSKTQKGTVIEKAVASVMTLTKSLGTPIVEKGWQVKKEGDKFLVRYLCEQSAGALESFDWLVDIDSKRAQAHNDNARMLMNRW